LSPTRRGFLRWATAIGSAISAVLVGLPALRAFLSPASMRPRKARWIKVGEVDQMETGVPIRFDFAETINDAWVETRALRGVWVYTEDGKRFSVYNGTCTHLACSYGFDKKRGVFHCPCHHGLFEIKTGKVLDGPPPRPLDTLETKVEEGYLYVAFENFRPGVPDKTSIG
jgi:menaquinol-cytochrome c reductase iron-sulfur subunit